MMSCLEALLEHNIACRPPMLKAIGQLTPGEFVQDLGVGRGSFRDILVHLLDTERYWTDHIIRGLAEDMFSSTEFQDVDAVEGIWSSISKSTMDLFWEQNEETLQYVKSVIWNDRTVSFTVGKVFMHLATHEIHHRGLLVGLLRQLGYEPPDVNML
jgi:uncharacterized damage-inducible protein DinB